MISIITSTYKQGKYLKELCERLNKQTLMDFEWIICDDGSSDYDIIKNLKPNFPLKYIWHQDIGCRWSKTHNNGIKLAEGKYVLFLHSDVMPDYKLIENYLSLAEPHVVVCGTRYESIDYQDPENTIKTEDWRLLIEEGKNAFFKIEYHPNPYTLISGCNILFYKKDLENVGLLDEDYPAYGYEDYDIALKLWAKGCKFIPAPDCFGYHIWHEFKDGDKKNWERFERRVNEYSRKHKHS
jgi:hypothetical protein